ncbi:MAG: S8 family serine peptidase [Candidatus Bathyarchaeia archaeon]
MKRITVLIIIGLLTANPVAIQPLSASSGEEGGVLESTSRFKSVYEVTLITGDTVTIGVTDEGEYRVIGIRPFDPTKFDRRFTIFSNERGLYVVPSDVDLKVFDIDLFNVKLLIEQMNVTGRRELRVIAQGLNAAQVEALLNTAANRKIPARLVSKHLNLAGVTLSMETPEEMNRMYMELQKFKKVYLDRLVKLSEGNNNQPAEKPKPAAEEVVKPLLWDSVPLIGANKAWNLNVTGTNVRIAILDTGIDSTHPVFLYPNGSSKVISNVDFTDDYDPRDFHGHGTHVASIAAGFEINYTYYNYSLTLLPNQWLGGGEPMGWHADDECWLYNLPFPFFFFSQNYTQIYISSNGLISFTYDRSWSNSVEGLARRRAIAVAWDDWRTDLGGDIYIWQPTPDSVAIRWEVVSFYRPRVQASFEAILYSNGTIQFNFGPCNGSVTATIGISDGAGFVLAEDVDNINYSPTRVYTPTQLVTTRTAEGVAPGALLMNVKVLNRDGWGYDSWIISGIEWAVENGADIISMSLGGYPTDGTDPLSLAADWAVSRGVTVVVAAGNEGEYFWILTPGVARNVITVGATDKWDAIAWFSSRGPTLDYRVKPEVVAPGVDIWAALARDSLIEDYVNRGYLPGIDVDGDGRLDLVPLSGTSMATPHVSGAVALIKQAKPYLTPLEIRSLLVSTAKDLGYDVYTQGGGRIDVFAAITSGLLIHPAVVSLGNVYTSLANFTITFTNLEDRNLTLSLTPMLMRIPGYDYWDNAVTLNTSLLYLPTRSSASVLVTINMSKVPTGYYSGIIYTNYTVNDIQLHAIFGFSKIYVLTVRFIDIDGITPLSNIPVYVMKTNPAYGEPYWYYNYTDENGVVEFKLSEGLYYVIGLAFSSSYATAWAIGKVNLTSRTYLVLNLSQAHTIDYVPPVPNQVIAYLSSSVTVKITYPDGWGSVSFGVVNYYPSVVRVISTTHDLPMTCGYTHYDRRYIHAPEPTTLLAPELYQVSFASIGLNRSVVVNPSKDQLAKIDKEYRVAQTPPIAASIYKYHEMYIDEWFLWSYFGSWVITAPKQVTEYLGLVTPQVYPSYLYAEEYYEKRSDLPGVTTPFFYYYIRYSYQYPGDYKVALNAHPLSPYIGLSVGSDGWFYIFTDVFSVDGFAFSPGIHMYGYLGTDTGRLVVEVNDTRVLGRYFYDYTYASFNIPLPAKVEVLLEGWSNMGLSSYAVTNITFTARGSISFWNPIVVQVLGLDLNNTHPGGLATVRVFSPYRINNVSLMYSFDNATWRQADLVSASDWEAFFSFYTSPGSRVALKVIANLNVGESVRVEYTVYNAFAVAPLAVYTLADFPRPFIDEFGDASSTLILVGASDPRGPCRAAHTIDVAASMYLAYILGLHAERGAPRFLMDWQAVHFNSTHAIRIFMPGNVITMGGILVNLVTWYYHDLTYRGIQQLPAYMAADAQGFYIYSPVSGNIYRMVNDYGQGVDVIDYAMIVLHYDPADNRYVLIIAGLSGYATMEAGKWLAQTPNLTGRAIILRFIDYSGDAIIDQIEIAEIIP